MAVAAALVPPIIEVFSWMAPVVAGAIASCIYLMGRGPQISEHFDTAIRTRNRARTPTPQLTPLAADMEARTSFTAVNDSYTILDNDLTEVYSWPITGSAIISAGDDPSRVKARTKESVITTIRSTLPQVRYPTFENLNQVEQYWTFWGGIASLGWIDMSTLRNIAYHCAAERARLEKAAAAPPTAIPAAAAAPITWVEVPGVGMVGVRVTVRAGETIVTPVTPTAPAIAPAAQPITVNVAAPVVNVAPPQVTVEAPPAPNVSVTPVIETAAIGAALTQALPQVGTAFASGLVSQGQNLGHLLQLGRNQCFAGTAGALMNLLLPTTLGAFSVMQLRDEAGIGGFISSQAKKWFEGALDPARFPRPATPETVFDAATARLKEAMAFGLQAHMWGILGESNFILKNLGLPQVAGFLADMAGFNRLAAATLGEVERAALSTPMRYLAQRTYTPYIPAIPDLEEMYAKKEIPYEAAKGELGLQNALLLHGIPETWAEVYREHLWKDPRLAEVIRIGQFFSPALVPALARPDEATANWMRRANIGESYINSPDWYYAWRAAKGGYDPRDVPILVETAKRATARREQTLFLDAATRLYRDGFVGVDRLQELTLEAWEFSNPILARLRACELQADYRVLSDTRSVVLMAMSRGLITRDEARAQLTNLGLPGQRVELEVLKATLGMIPGVRLEISRPEEILEEAGLEIE